MSSNFAIVNGYLVERIGECNCAGADIGVGIQHERGCGEELIGLADPDDPCTCGHALGWHNPAVDLLCSVEAPVPCHCNGFDYDALARSYEPRGVGASRGPQWSRDNSPT